jgi:hypothetical protein
MCNQINTTILYCICGYQVRPLWLSWGQW